MAPFQDFDANTLLNNHEKDISSLGDKLCKCYSSERYSEFQDAVKKISLEGMDVSGTGGGQEKIKHYALQAIRDYNKEDIWRKITFWAPILISIIALIFTAYSVFKAKSYKIGDDTAVISKE